MSRCPNGTALRLPPDGRVIELALGGNGLSGELPAEMGDLANLTALWLYGNQLSGVHTARN